MSSEVAARTTASLPAVLVSRLLPGIAVVVPPSSPTRASASALTAPTERASLSLTKALPLTFAQAEELKTEPVPQ